MRVRAVRSAAVIAAVAAVALTATEVAWAPWSTGQTDEAINDLKTCPDGMKFELAGSPRAPTLHTVIAVNWHQARRFPPPDKILFDGALPLQKQAVQPPVGGTWAYYGVVTVLWGRLLTDDDRVAISFDRFGDPDRFYNRFRVGDMDLEDCPVSVSNRVEGDERHDLIVANGQDNVLVGNGGNDFIKGRAGDDTIRGGRGDDDLWAGPGADTVEAGDGNDSVHAVADDDQLDRIDCGAGNDVVFLNSLEADVQVNCEHVVIETVTDPNAD